MEVQVLLPAPNQDNPRLTPVGASLGFIFCRRGYLLPRIFTAADICRRGYLPPRIFAAVDICAVDFLRVWVCRCFGFAAVNWLTCGIRHSVGLQLPRICSEDFRVRGFAAAIGLLRGFAVAQEKTIGDKANSCVDRRGKITHNTARSAINLKGRRFCAVLYKIINGAVCYGADMVLENIDFEIHDNQKIALVGRNGCGKTTLLKAIIGQKELEEGTGEQPFTVIKSGNPTIGYLEQISFADPNATMLDEVLKAFAPLLNIEKRMAELVGQMENGQDGGRVAEYSELSEKYERMGGFTYKKEYLTMIKKFGFSEADKSKRISEFSGGQRTKIAFIKLLLSKPDIMLLDEPTNHLDIETVEWLENYLKSYKSSVVIVSHDRMFLDKIVDRVYEIEYGETKGYTGNYADFERQKRQNYQKQLKDCEAQRAEVKRLTGLVERFRYKATKAAMVKSKLKQIERIQTVGMPDRYDLRTFHADFQPTEPSAKIALRTSGLEVGYNRPIARIDTEIFYGQKLGVIGANGRGKSTFLKTLAGIIPQLSGRFEFGANVSVGYFDQQMAEISGSRTIFEDFAGAFPKMNDTEVRTALGAFQFGGEDVFKQISALSGGEKVRLALCKIFRRRPNMLILDEPTNHMDIVGKETLENMLSAYSGTVIFVSHDRYFINKIADRLLIFDKNGAHGFAGGYSEYEASRAEQDADERPQKSGAASTGGGKKGYFSPLKEKSKKERRAAKLETLITECETKIAELCAELEKPEICSDYQAVSELQDKLDRLRAEQDGYTAEWVELSEQLENL